MEKNRTVNHTDLSGQLNSGISAGNASGGRHPDYQKELLSLLRSGMSPKLLKEEIRNYHENDIADVLEKAAENEGDNMMNTAVGLGAGINIGNQIGTMAAQQLNTLGAITDDVPPLPVVKYYLAINGKKEGPFTTEQVEQKYNGGEISASTLMWKKGMKNWEALSQVDDFRHLFDEDCPPPIPNEL